MATKIQTNEKGQTIVKLPTSGTEVILRQPKGKDLKAIEVATKATEATNIGVLMLIASLLAVSPEMSLEEVEDLDAEDVEVLGEAIGNFRAFNKLA